MPESRRPRTPSVVHRSTAHISVSSPDPQGDALDNVRSLRPVDRLIQRAKDGDKDAYGQVFRLHRDAICRLARLHIGSEVDDIVAEVFTTAWVQLPRYRPNGTSFAAWLYGIARRVFADEQQRQATIGPPAERDTLEKWAEDERRSLAAAIAALPEEQRHMIEMKFLMDMRIPEFAIAMDTTPDDANQKQWRALTALQSEMVEHT